MYDTHRGNIAMASMEIRINARLIDEDTRNFRELRKREGLFASELFCNALRDYHTARVRLRVNAAALMEATGFIGSGEGPVDLSSRTS